MHIRVVLKIVGLLLMLYSFTMVPPLLVSFWNADAGQTAFLSAFVVILLSGLLIWLPLQNQKYVLHSRDGFMVAILFWTTFALAGSLPLYFSLQPTLSFTDALFESFSGLTTTGTTVLNSLDTLPRSILYYRQQLQWIGGMGIVVLAVAVLPMLGVGGMQLFRVEANAMSTNKLTPRINETARSLWLIYVFLTALCALCYWLAGMSFFDALGHSFSTISTGGFSTHDQNMAYFDNAFIESICMVFMVISAMNFSLHFLLWRNRSFRHYGRDIELRMMLLFMLATTLAICLLLYMNNTYPSLPRLLHHGLFQTLSMLTTTGYSLVSFDDWPAIVPMLLVMASFVGTSSGSTGGGIKMMRALLLVQQARQEIRKLIHPHAVLPIKIGQKVASDQTLIMVWAFVGAYMALFIVLMTALMAFCPALSVEDSFFAIAASMNNLGVGAGALNQHYPGINDAGKWLLCLSMLAGRLEVFTLLVLVSPAFWRR